MWVDEADGFAEIFRGYIPYYLLVALPILIIMAPVSPVAGSHEFSVYRMQQYDLHTVAHGSRSSSINLEGRSLTSWSTSRHCVMARMQDITIEHFQEIRAKAGALLLVLPKNNTLLTKEERQHIQLLEMAMTQQDFSGATYFMKWTPEVDGILEDIQHSFITDDKSGTALEAMLNTVSSNGYQIVVTATSPVKIDSKANSIHGKLVGSGSGQTIVIAAHYDSFAVAPDLSLGADSNASGVVALLELARVFSRLYAVATTRGSSTLVFLLTGTGHALNYFSAKKWLEDQLDSADGPQLHDVSFAMCIDAVSSSPNLMMHVSKPPKQGGDAYSIQTRLGVDINHKKINLADELLAWQHERFSIRRMAAFTISSLQSHKDPSRGSILDEPSEEQLLYLVNNIKNIARGLASHIYNINITTDRSLSDQAKLFDDILDVDEKSIKFWYKYLTSQTRSPQFVTKPKASGLSMVLESALSQYLSDVVTSTHTADKREPEYAVYAPTKATLFVYSVKPAVFDLILTAAILAYLAVLYFAMQCFPKFYEHYARLITGKEKVH